MEETEDERRIRREKQAAYQRERRAADPERIRAMARASRARRKDRVNENKRKWAAENKERVREQRRRWYYANYDDRWKNYVLKKKYGITVEQYNLILQEQNGVCAICSSPPPKRYFDVDHDHATGRVRGLLCNPCNRAVSCLRDSVQNAEAAARYLLKNKES